MRLIVYSYDSFGCGLVVKHAREFCEAHGIEFRERNWRDVEPLQKALIRGNDLDCMEIAFVVRDGDLLRAFGESRWSAFEAEIKGEG